MKRVKFLFFTFVFTLLCAEGSAQSIPTDISSLSDEQLKEYWNQAKSQGYTIEQLKVVAQAKGATLEQITQIESRINSLNTISGGLEGQQINNALGVSNATPVGFVDNVSTLESSQDPIFGIDFFNNPNISFTPNLNVATPDNYQLGPGDEVVINIWGAAENTYSVEIDREGVLRIPNAGPVFVNGMNISAAKEIILNKLKRVYAGINAPDSSPYKVFSNISLSKIRSIQVNIIGEVKVPGTYTLSSLSTVLNALYASGGPTENGTFRQIKLVRNGQEAVYFDMYKYLIQGSQNGNITLRDNDVIIVSPFTSRVRVKGAVKRPGIYELKGQESFSDLLRFVSGFKAKAFKDKFSLLRIEGDKLVIKEIDYKNMINQNLQNGDKIEVFSIIDEIRNSVSIQGPVYRPGSFEFKEGITLIDLINKASGVRDDIYLERGVIYRGNDFEVKKVIPFKLSEVLNGGTTIVLENNDSVKLFSRSFLNNSEGFYISGGVNNPGAFAYYDNLTVEDLILFAGGLSDKANPSIIDVFRRVNDDNFETLTESFKISAGNTLDFSNTSDFELKPGDRIAVRLLKGISDSVKVEVEGEVNYPGTYSAASKDEHISDFIEKAGGLSQYAFTEGATLVRLNPYYKDEAQELTATQIKEPSVKKINLNNKKEFRVGIDLEKIMANPDDTKENIVIKDGDRIIIPSIKSTIKTEGEILIPSLIRHEGNLSFKDYINKSGGFASDAIKRKSYVIRPNGDIAATTNFLFFNSYPKVTPGSIIIVPKKVTNPDPISAQEILGLTSGFATLALLVDRLLN